MHIKLNRERDNCSEYDQFTHADHQAYHVSGEIRRDLAQFESKVSGNAHGQTDVYMYSGF